MSRSITIEELEARCRALLEEVAESREALVVTEAGRAVARVEPVAEPRSLIGTAQQLCSDDELVYFSMDWGEGDTELLRALDE